MKLNLNTLTKYKRIKLNLEDLPPKSVSKIFNFINDLFDNIFDGEYFDRVISTYNIGETYFTYFYLKKYLSDNFDGYLNKTFYQSEEDLQKVILENIKYIETSIEKSFKTVERRYKKEFLYGKHKHSLKTENVFNERIQLFFTINDEEYRKFLKIKDTIRITDKFKSRIKEILKEDFSEKDFEEFFNNSFSYPNNITDVESLFIEIDNSGRLYKNMYKVYRYYNDTLRKEYDTLNERFNRALVNRKTIYPKEGGSINSKKFKRLINLNKRIKPEKLKRIDLILIMYNTFPQIRESTKNYLNKNPSIKKMDYLRIKSKNLKK